MSDQESEEEDLHFGIKSYIRCLIFEDCDNPNLNYTENDDKEQITFTYFTGPTVSYHMSKMVMMPYIINPLQNEDFSKTSTTSPQFNQCMTEQMLNFFGQTKPCLDYSYFLILKLGIYYFTDRGISLKNKSQNFSLKKLKTLLMTKTKENRNSYLCHSAYNGNKGVTDQIKLELYLNRNNFRYLNKEKTYSLKFSNRQMNNFIQITLDENFRFLRAYKDSIKMFNIDYLRDRRISLEKLSGTYADIFDIRLNLTKMKSISQQECIDYLLVDTATYKGNILEDLVSRDEDGNFVLNKSIGLPLTYLRETDRETFHTREKNDDFLKYFSVYLEKITEYTRIKNKIPNKIVLEKILVANSTLSAEFDLNKWLENRIGDKIEESMFYQMADEIFKQMANFSNQIYFINNETNGNLNKSENEMGVFDVFKVFGNTENSVSSLATNIKYSYQNKLIDYDSFACLKKLTYSRNFLDIFDVNVNTLTELTDENMEKTARKLISIFNIFAKCWLNMNPKEYKGKGMVRTAYKKFHDAYRNLSDPNKRRKYIAHLTCGKSVKNETNLK